MTALFIVEPTGTCRLALRRFTLGGTPDHYHDADVVIDENAPATPRCPDGTRSMTDDRIPHDDLRWPGTCPCGYAFRPEDRWQVNEVEWYEGGGHRFAWGTGSWVGPPGAMIRAEWRDNAGRPPAYVVFLPNGTWWCTNDPASAGPGSQLGPQWTVTGDAPRITVSPSIDDRSSRPWHGWIRDGHLVAA